MNDGSSDAGRTGGGSHEPPPAASARSQPDLTGDAALLAVLQRSQDVGLLGRAPLEAHVAHSLGFLDGLPATVGALIDLGAGGGVPGLVLARALPDCEVVLLDAAKRRCTALQEAVDELEITERVHVVHARAEDAGRGAWRGWADAVTARSFARPAVTAECAAPLLRLGGQLVVSEPPDGAPRWPEAALAPLGLQPTRRWHTTGTFQALTQVAPCPPTYPRRPGIPDKRPLF